MALTYTQSSDLMKDPSFIGRIKVACLKYAAYILDEPSNVPAHSSRVRWAQETNINSERVAMGLAPSVVMDGQVQTDGAAISDAALQTAVETTVNKML
jgi:hypothetical protein